MTRSNTTQHVLTFYSSTDDNRATADLLSDLVREFRKADEPPLIMTCPCSDLPDIESGGGNFQVNVSVGSPQLEAAVRQLLTARGWKDADIASTTRNEDEDWRGIPAEMAMVLGSLGRNRASNDAGKPLTDD